MKIIIINGSPRGLNGNTGQLVKVFAESVINEGAEIEVVNLTALSLNPCQGARYVLRQGPVLSRIISGTFRIAC